MRVTVQYLEEPVELDLRLEKYLANSRTAVVAYENGELFGQMTINLVDYPAAANEICVKTADENSGWVPQLLTLLPQVFQDTGKRIQSGHAVYDVWTCNAELLENSTDDDA